MTALPLCGRQFHAACGGGTDCAADVWAVAPEHEHGGAPCSPCAESQRRWETALSWEEVLDSLGFPAGAEPVELEPAERTPSGRIRTVTLRAGAAQADLPAEDLRAALGYGRVASARFEVDTIPAAGCCLRGVGHGHGVGLCQHGARTLAAAGHGHREILARYYPGTRLAGARS